MRAPSPSTVGTLDLYTFNGTIVHRNIPVEKATRLVRKAQSHLIPGLSALFCTENGKKATACWKFTGGAWK